MYLINCRIFNLSQTFFTCLNDDLVWCARLHTAFPGLLYWHHSPLRPKSPPHAAFHFHSGISRLASVLLAVWIGQSLWWVWSLDTSPPAGPYGRGHGSSPLQCSTGYPSNTVTVLGNGLSSCLSPAVLFLAAFEVKD